MPCEACNVINRKSQLLQANIVSSPAELWASRPDTMNQLVKMTPPNIGAHGAPSATDRPTKHMGFQCLVGRTMSADGLIR